MFNPDTGTYSGFVKIRSTVNCKLAYKLIYDHATGGAGWYPAGGWQWWPGYNNTGGFWRNGAKELGRGFHIARTNERTGDSARPTMLEHDLITYDSEVLRNCSTVPNKAYVPCVNVTPASYAGVPL